MCFIILNNPYTAHRNSLGISVICMGLLISRPSVFVWEPEACLSTVFVVFVERRALYKGKLYLR